MCIWTLEVRDVLKILWKRGKIASRCQGTAGPLDGRPKREASQTWQAGCGSFLLLRRRRSQQLVAVNFQPQHVRKLPERSLRSFYQFSLPTTSLSRHVAACTALVCEAQCSMPVRLGYCQSQTSNICSEMTRQWPDRSAMSKPQDIVTTRSNELLAQLGIDDVDLILKERRLCWYGHMERSNGAVKTAFDQQVDGKRGPGRPKMKWKQLTERDYREWKLSVIDHHDGHSWRSGVRTAIHTASQLPGRGPTDVDVALVPAC